MLAGTPYDKGIRKNQLSGSYGDFLPVHVQSNGQRYPTDILYFKTAESEGEVIHPTQKPVEMGRYFVRTYSNPGDVILDNTSGSGSFVVAALLEGRNFVAIEKNKDVALFKKKKVDYIKATKQRLYNAWISMPRAKKISVKELNVIKDFENVKNNSQEERKIMGD